MSNRRRSGKARRTRAPKGKRYSLEEKRKALELAARVGVKEASKRTGISAWSLYSWRNALKLAPVVEKPAPGVKRRCPSSGCTGSAGCR